MSTTTSESINHSAATSPWSGSTTAASVELTGRLLLSLLFLVAGLEKMGSYAGTSSYMNSFGVPGSLLPLVILAEVAGGVAILMGWRTRITALLLAGYSVLAALIFHRHLGDPVEQVMFLKDFAIAGGLLLLVADGAGPMSMDNRMDSGTTPRASTTPP